MVSLTRHYQPKNGGVTPPAGGKTAACAANPKERKTWLYCVEPSSRSTRKKSSPRSTPPSTTTPRSAPKPSASSLWENIEEPYIAAADLTAEDAISLALARDAELESGTVSPLSHVELMSRLRR